MQAFCPSYISIVKPYKRLMKHLKKTGLQLKEFFPIRNYKTQTGALTEVVAVTRLSSILFLSKQTGLSAAIATLGPN